MKIGITARFEVSPHGDSWFVFEQKLLYSLKDYLPEASINLITPENTPSIDGLDLIVFTGGSTPGCDVSRDRFERSIYEKGNEHSVPILGICRGAQLFASFSGVGLIPIENHVGEIRKMKGLESLGTCYHEWGFLDLPSEWHVLSRDSQDKTIELFKHEELPIVGVLAHPERSSKPRAYFEKLLSLLES
jgi:gamma-glutamyl-gamma-aminobutyrate hydrolase PuuD